MWTISLIFLSVFLSCDMSSSVLTSTSSTTSSTHTFDETTTTTDAAAATVAYQDQTSASRDLDQYDQKKETENDFKITINITTNNQMVTTGSKLGQMVTTGFKLDQMVTTQPNVLDTTSDIYNSYSESQAQDSWTLDSETKRLLEKPKVVEPQHILTTQRNSEHKVDGPQHLLTTQRDRQHKVDEPQHILPAQRDSQHKMKTVIRLHNPFMKTRQSQHFLKNSKIRSGRKSITNKPLIKYDIDNNQDGEYDTLEGIDYDDDSIYTLAHFRFELYSHVDDRISILNVSVLQLLASMQEKITQLETQVLDNMAFRCALESKLRIDINPQPGDIRLLSQGNCGKDITTGYLQFYTGTDWGFVCDDFFNSGAARVSCNQLGYAESNSSTMSARRSSKSYKTGSSLGQTWSEHFSIVLDDVQCTGNENNLDSCEHSVVGHHDCSLDELVFLTC
uniref:SRCR domain-containing protein n=1 Tax=Arion vulgaris TaxID=1028688 RepID=A0A0B7A6E7_9EUPU